ncbi:trypsin-like serine protease [SAR202 cluster bacterium AD-802-E10_MRT_200m]|nr:trypsin-like serine protease [SAR202 cluster bacterium AD-802-E10_MRT_200m]
MEQREQLERKLQLEKKNLVIGALLIAVIILAGVLAYELMAIGDIKADAKKLQTEYLKTSNLTLELETALQNTQSLIEQRDTQERQRTNRLSVRLDQSEEESKNTNEKIDGIQRQIEQNQLENQQEVLDIKDNANLLQSTLQTRIQSNADALNTHDNTLSTHSEEIDQATKGFNKAYTESFTSVFCLSFIRRCNGTGWLISDGFLLTSKSVVGNPGMKVLVQQAQGSPFTATVDQVHNNLDLALLSFDTSLVTLDPSATPLNLRSLTAVDNGIPLMALGYSSKRAWVDGTSAKATITEGNLSQIVDFGDSSYGNNLEINIPIDPGDVGGPVIDFQGNVVGINRDSRDRFTGTGDSKRFIGTYYAVHADEIYNAFPDLNTNR